MRTTPFLMSIVASVIALLTPALGGDTRNADEEKPCMFEKAPHEHVEEIAAHEHGYRVTMGGTLDGFNTVAYVETYGSHMRQESTFEPNEYLVIENAGDVDVVNPRLVINGRRDWHSADAILASIVTQDMSDAEKAMAIFRFTSRIDVQAHDNNRRVGPPFGASGSETQNADASNPSRNMFKERANPVKAANFYYCSGCSLSAANFVVLCRHAGLAARGVWMSPLDRYMTHCVGEAWYDGGWHLFDPERRSFYLDADNTTVASYATLHKNPSLAARTHDGGFAAQGMTTHAGDYEQFYPPHIMPVEQWLSTMDMRLRPGEKFIARWGHEGKYRYGANVRKKSHLVPYHLANGKLVFRPRIEGDAYRRSIVADQNLTCSAAQGQPARLHPEVVEAPGIEGAVIAAPPGSVTYRIDAPYPIVGGKVGGTFLRKTAEDACRILVSVRDSDWIEVWSAAGMGEIEQYAAIDDVLDTLLTPATYHYYVKFELQACAGPEDACMMEAYIETDLQMADTALPALSTGENRVVYRDNSGAGRRVRITHGWRESDANTPPLPPAAAVAPPAGSTVDAASLGALAWEAAVDPDGDAVADYHIQVSPRADMAYPVSPNFDRILGANTPEWAVPTGWLVPRRTYYWRVKAKDARGAWSAWGPVWSFTVNS